MTKHALWSLIDLRHSVRLLCARCARRKQYPCVLSSSKLHWQAPAIRCECQQISQRIFMWTVPWMVCCWSVPAVAKWWGSEASRPSFNQSETIGCHMANMTYGLLKDASWDCSQWILSSWTTITKSSLLICGWTVVACWYCAVHLHKLNMLLIFCIKQHSYL